jgi:predicted Zn-dependent peptidase
MKKLNFDPYDFSIKEIDGVPVYYKNIPWANCLFLNIVFKSGALNDPEDKEGLAHFLEHMMFDGSESFPDKKAIKKWSKENTLNTFNAYTSYYNTTYHLKCLPDNFKKVLIDLKDIIFKPLFTQESFLGEKNVITQEAWGRYKNEKFLNYLKEINSILLPNHKLGKILRPLGFPNTIEKIEREDISKFYKENYVKENTFIVLVGKITEQDIETVSEFIKVIPEGKINDIKFSLPEKPTQSRIVKKSDEIGEPKEQTEIGKVINIKKPGQEYSVYAIFRDLFSDILYERLRTENNLCYSLSVNIYPEKYFSTFIFSVKTDTKNIEIVEKEFDNILSEIKDSKWVDRFELIKKIRYERIISAERLSGEIIEQTVSDIVLEKLKSLEEYISDEEKVNYSDIVHFLNQNFVTERIFTEIILSSKN